MAPSVKKSTPVSDVKETVKEVVKEPAPMPTPAVEVKKAPVRNAKAAKVQPETPVEVKEPSAEVSKEDTSATVPAEAEKEPENVLQVLTDKITSLATLNKEIQMALKQVAKNYEKLQKVVDKIQKKRDNARKSPSGVAKPNKISDELCDFIGVPHGTEKSRTDITRYINSYVKEHNLNKPTNRRIILPDPKLRAILNVKDGEEVTFFILQRLISHHFPPKK